MKPITGLKKELKEAESFLCDVEESIKKGWKCYLATQYLK